MVNAVVRTVRRYRRAVSEDHRANVVGIVGGSERSWTATRQAAGDSNEAGN